MALGSRVRALEEEKNGLMERLEEEEERAKELTRQIQTHTQQVSHRRCQSLLGCCITLRLLNLDISKPAAAGRAAQAV